LNLAVSHADNHEAATPNVSGLRVNHREGKADRDGGINGITPLQHDLFADLTCDRAA
jgi:hypothetical protein